MSSKTPSKRSGKIELLRFLFCMAVLLFHANKYFLDDISVKKDDLHPVLFVHGFIGVEFFFITSGYLMAKSALKKAAQNGGESDLGVETTGFLLGKIKGIWSFHIMTFVTALLSYLWIHDLTPGRTVRTILSALPSLFLIQKTGFDMISPNHLEWYLSVMLLSMLMLYPVLRRYYSMFVRVIAPILFLGILGWMFQTYGSISGVGVWTGLTYKSVLRGVAEICMGATAFEVTRRLGSASLSKNMKGLLTVIELGLTVGIFIFMNITLEYQYDFTCTFAIMLLVILAFSDQTYGSRLFNNKLFYFLGQYSLPIYLSQVTCINIVSRIGEGFSPQENAVIFVAMTLAMAAFIMLIDKLLRKRKAVNKTAEAVNS